MEPTACWALERLSSKDFNLLKLLYRYFRLPHPGFQPTSECRNLCQFRLPLDQAQGRQWRLRSVPRRRDASYPSLLTVYIPGAIITLCSRSSLVLFALLRAKVVSMLTPENPIGAATIPTEEPWLPHEASPVSANGIR